MDMHHPAMHALGTSTCAVAAVARSSSGQGLGPVKEELEAELRGLCMAARMHGFTIAVVDGKPTIQRIEVAS